LAGAAGNFRRPGDDLGVSRPLGEIGPGIGTQLGVATAKGEFAEQHLEDGARQQILGRALRQLLGDRSGRRVAGSQGVSAVGQTQGEREGGSDVLQLHGRLSV
jgi:hypothetical protein